MSAVVENRIELRKLLKNTKKIEILGKYNDIYSSDTNHRTANCYPQVLEPSNKFILDTESRFAGCRELICQYMIERRRMAPNLWTNYTSLLLYKFNNENLKKGLRIVHYFERKAGLGLTFIHPLKDYLYVCGPKAWSDIVPTMSVYTLLLKAISKFPINPGETVGRYLKRLGEDRLKQKKDERYYIFEIISTHKDLITILMRNHKELKRYVDMTYKGVNMHYGREEGISKVITRMADKNYAGIKHHSEYADQLATIVKKYKGKRCL